jgi:organic hydroperoxide reductase OsmC/OhrA
MPQYTATILWNRRGAAFTDNRYSRGHIWRFDGGIEVPASSSPHLVPLPMSIEAAVDPEEAFVASLASCHMLWFLSIAAKRGFVVEAYRDEAVGVMAKNIDGKLAVTEVTLRPAVEFSGENQPNRDVVAQIHHEAHERCFIANSVKTHVSCQPVFADTQPSPPSQPVNRLSGTAE